MRLLPLVLSLTLLAPSGVESQAMPDSRPGVAVFPFANGGSIGPNREDLAALEIGIQHMLLTELAQTSSP